MNGVRLAESGLLPDFVVRWGIRRNLRQRLSEVAGGSPAEFAAELRRAPIALVPELANEQHYEVPPELFQAALGPRLKYSCALYPEGGTDLATAEERMLALSCERAGLRDGMSVLDLGCGWGSLTLWIAERYPASTILAVSNSKPQREFILAECARRSLRNVDVVTADINDFDTGGRRFDRVVSVEMFEHLRNYERLFRRIADWLEPDGKLFAHVFCHREYAYPYESEGEDNWMGRTFFSGGLMPSEDLLPMFQEDLRLEQQWRVDGRHYSRTCEDWLRRLDARRETVLPILASTYGSENAALWLQRWRMFFLACSELFAYRGGQEWFVAHYRFARRESGR